MEEVWGRRAADGGRMGAMIIDEEDVFYAYQEISPSIDSRRQTHTHTLRERDRL